MKNWRWFWGLFCFLVSLLVLFEAPAKCFWYVAIGATEWCYVGVMMAWLPFLVPGPSLRGASTLSLLAGLIFLTPIIRAWPIARRLPSECETRFGQLPPAKVPGSVVRQTPLSLLDLVRGIHTSPVEVHSYVYSRVSGEVLNFDLFTPNSHPHKLPGLLVVHGGSWASGKRDEFSELNRYLAAQGYLVADLDYRLAPRWHFPAAREDVFSALAYLKQHAPALGLDPSRLVLLGRSAGGQIALAVAYSQRDPAIRGVIAFYAPSDLVFAYNNPSNPLIMNSRKVLETYIGGVPQALPALYLSASPLNAVRQNSLPTLLIHGGRDELVWSVHSDRLAQRLETEGVPHLYLRLPWATHGCDVNFQGPSGQLSTYAIERFLAFVTK